jgi:hypothetical protein
MLPLRCDLFGRNINANPAPANITNKTGYRKPKVTHRMYSWKTADSRKTNAIAAVLLEFPNTRQKSL